MIKKYLPHIILLASLVVLVIMMTHVSENERLGISLVKPKILIEATISIILMTIGIAIIMKRN